MTDITGASAHDEQSIRVNATIEELEFQRGVMATRAAQHAAEIAALRAQLAQRDEIIAALTTAQQPEDNGEDSNDAD